MRVITLTAEDAVIATRLSAIVHHEMSLGDRADYRAMLAREQDRAADDMRRADRFFGSLDNRTEPA